MTREDRVMEFIEASKPPSYDVAWKCFYEELAELDEAANNFIQEEDENTRAHFVKEWADVQYTLSQLAIAYNINGEEAFNRVASNNMTKVIDGEVRYREDGKVLKPDNYMKPDMSGL